MFLTALKRQLYDAAGHIRKNLFNPLMVSCQLTFVMLASMTLNIEMLPL